MLFHLIYCIVSEAWTTYTPYWWIELASFIYNRHEKYRMRFLLFLIVIKVFGLVPPNFLLPVDKLDDKVRDYLTTKFITKIKDILTSGLFFKENELQSYIESFKFSQDIQESSIVITFVRELNLRKGTYKRNFSTILKTLSCVMTMSG